MSSNKKKCDYTIKNLGKINSENITTSNIKSIDSFFSSVSTSNSTLSSFLSDTNNISRIEYINKDIKTIEVDNNKLINDTKENILKKLMQHKIMYSHTEIKNKINNLSEDEITEIFKIIKNNNEKYSTNKNGIFINLSTLTKNTILEISNFLYFCDNNNKAIIEEEIERAKYKEMIID
jgi:hypothetical protein